MPQLQNPQLESAAKQVQPQLLGSLGQLRILAKLRGVNLSAYGDNQLVEIIMRACEIYLESVKKFEFKPVWKQKK